MANEINIIVRAKDATMAAWRSVQRGAKGAAKNIGRAFSGIGRFAKQSAIAIALLGGAVAAASKHFIGFASIAEETQTKFEAVYRSTIDLAYAMSHDLAESFDLADSTAQQMLADTGDLLTGFGFAGKEALVMSDKVNRLAIDLASFTNYSKGASGASQALTKLLLGETEQAKSLGIVVRQGSDEFKNAVKAKQQDEHMTLLQAKATVALEMATRQSINAIGDYEKTQGGVANKQRAATEAFKEAKEAIGAAIIEHSNYADILTLVIDKTRELTEGGHIELWAENVASTIKFLVPMFKGIAAGLGTVKQKIADTAAFIGGVVGSQGTIGERLTAGSDAIAQTRKDLEQDNEVRLAEIKAGKLKKLDERMKRIRQQDKNAAEQEFKKLNDKELKTLKRTLKEFTMSKEEKRKIRKQNRREELDEDAVDRARDKIKNKRRVSQRERDLVLAADLRKNIGMHEELKKDAEKNIAEAAIQAAQTLREQQLNELKKQTKTLKQSVELA